MSLPHLLAVDDSEAVLAFTRAALAGHCAISTASNGREALEKAAQLAPDVVLLDLSMPEMDGSEVLARLKADAALRSVPVVILSSETSRAQECRDAGAFAFLSKPPHAATLLETIAEALADARRARRQGALPVLPIAVGQLRLALPLSAVRAAYPQLATRALPTAPPFLSRVLALDDRAPVAVLDLGRRLGAAPAVPYAEQKLVLVELEGLRLALCVDRVFDPEEVPPERVSPPEQFGGTRHGLLRECLVAMVRRDDELLPVLHPRTFLDRRLLRELPALLTGASPPSSRDARGGPPRGAP